MRLRGTPGKSGRVQWDHAENHYTETQLSVVPRTPPKQDPLCVTKRPIPPKLVSASGVEWTDWWFCFLSLSVLRHEATAVACHFDRFFYRCKPKGSNLAETANEHTNKYIAFTLLPTQNRSRGARSIMALAGDSIMVVIYVSLVPN